MLKVIDLKLSNIGSIVKSLKHIGAEFQVVDKPQELNSASGLILPGVGCFSTAAIRLEKTGFYQAIQDSVNNFQTPILGICVGMQLLANHGEEGGGYRGLNLINANVNKLSNSGGQVRIPHVGWNDINADGLPLFHNIEQSACFYFVHSYGMSLHPDETATVATTHHGENIVAYVNKGHIHGAQFHPEKSQSCGLTFLRNFVILC